VTETFFFSRAFEQQH